MNSMGQEYSNGKPRVLETHYFKSDFKPDYSWLKDLTNPQTKKNKIIKDMEKYGFKNDDSKAVTYRIDFDEIPNQNIVYQEKQTDSPDGFGMYKPSKFV